MLPGIGGVAGFASSASVVTDPDFASTLLLVSGDGTNGSQVFTDLSASARGNATFPVGNGPTVSTAVKQFGSGSIRFDAGNNDCARWADSADWSGNSDYTKEGFVRFDSATTTQILWQHWSGTTNRGWRLLYRGASTPKILSLEGSTAGATIAVVVSGNWTPTIDTFYYVCEERSGNTTRLYVGDVGGTANMLAKTTTGFTYFDSTAPFSLGDTDVANSMAGYKDNFRYTSIARYDTDAGFPVPTAAFPTS